MIRTTTAKVVKIVGQTQLIHKQKEVPNTNPTDDNDDGHTYNDSTMTTMTTAPTTTVSMAVTDNQMCTTGTNTGMQWQQ